AGGAGRGGGAGVRIAGGSRAGPRSGGARNGVGTGCPARPGAAAAGDHPAGAGPPALEPAGGGRGGAGAAGPDRGPRSRAAAPGRPRLGAQLRTLALISLGTTEYWAAGEDPERHLEMGVALARRIGRPFLEFTGLAYQTAAGLYQSFTRAGERGKRAIELAER